MCYLCTRGARTQGPQALTVVVAWIVPTLRNLLFPQNSHAWWWLYSPYTAQGGVTVGGQEANTKGCSLVQVFLQSSVPQSGSPQTTTTQAPQRRKFQTAPPQRSQRRGQWDRRQLGQLSPANSNTSTGPPGNHPHIQEAVREGQILTTLC